LSDNSDHYGVNKVNDGLDFAFLGIALLLLIGFGLYFIFRKPNTIGQTNSSFAAFSDPSVDDPNFERVKDSVISDAAANAPANDGLYPWNATDNALPTFDTADATCADAATCVMRAQVLARNAKIVKGDLAGAQEGGENTRLQFFPDCTNSASDYVFFYGTESQVQGALSNLKFDITDLTNATPDALVVTDQQAKDDLNNNGLLATENPSTALTAADGANCGTGLTPYAFTPATTTLKGALYYIDHTPDANGNVDTTELDTIHSGVSVGAYRNGSLLANGNLFTGGIYTIPNVPVNPDSDYPVTIKIEDASNVFDDDQLDAVVPSTAGAEVSTGRTQLVTKDGNVCADTDNACISNQSAATGDVTVTVTNSQTGAPVSGVSVDLKEGSSITGSTAQTATTNDDGVATFSGVEYGQFTPYISDSAYEPADGNVALQTPTAATAIALTPVDSEFDMSLSMNTGDENADMDFKLYAQNPAGEECEASPLNKYCAYAQHYVDATPEAPGSEIINIKDLAVAKYRTTVEPAPTYSATCAQADASNVNYHDFSFWNWGIFKQTRPLTLIPFRFFRRFG
jgi:hypothetical protein